MTSPTARRDALRLSWLCLLLILGAPPHLLGQETEGGHPETPTRPGGAELVDRMERLTGHLRQMASAAQRNPELEGQWVSAAALRRMTELSQVVGIATQQLTAADRALKRAGGDREFVEGTPALERELPLIRQEMSRVMEALAGLVRRVEALERVAHGDAAHGHENGGGPGHPRDGRDERD